MIWSSFFRVDALKNYLIFSYMYKKFWKPLQLDIINKTKKGQKKGFLKDIKIFLKKKKKNSDNFVLSNIRNFLNMNSKNRLSMENIIIKCGKIKTLHNNILALFSMYMHKILILSSDCNISRLLLNNCFPFLNEI